MHQVMLSLGTLRSQNKSIVQIYLCLGVLCTLSHRGISYCTQSHKNQSYSYEKNLGPWTRVESHKRKGHFSRNPDYYFQKSRFKKSQLQPFSHFQSFDDKILSVTSISQRTTQDGIRTVYDNGLVSYSLSRYNELIQSIHQSLLPP